MKAIEEGTAMFPFAYSIQLRRLMVSMILESPAHLSTLENTRDQLRLLCKQSRDCECGHLVSAHTGTFIGFFLTSFASVPSLGHYGECVCV
jgi:hypothetical protein